MHSQVDQNKPLLEERKDHIFNYICRAWFENQYNHSFYDPSYSKIESQLEIPRASISRIVKELYEKEHLLERDDNKKYFPSEKGFQQWASENGIQLNREETVVELPHSHVGAGMTLTTDDVEGIVEGEDGSTYLVSFQSMPRHPHELFALTVEGESMINACIKDKDTLVFRQIDNQRPTNGDIVAAGVETEPGTIIVTVKHYHYDSKKELTKRVELRPANENEKPIYAREDKVRVYGKMVRLIREYS